VRRSIEETIAFLDQQAASLQQQIREHIDNTPSLKADKELLTSIPGIGEIAAQQILAGHMRHMAELPDVSQFQSAESAGLAPSEFRSGKSVHKHTRLSKAGNRHLRVHACVNGQAVYFPAVTAIGHNPLVRALYERLIASGKARMAAIGAAMRKVLMLAFGVLKTRQPFDPNWASRQVQPTT
jgi:hypothetical protein